MDLNQLTETTPLCRFRTVEQLKAALRRAGYSEAPQAEVYPPNAYGRCIFKQITPPPGPYFQRGPECSDYPTRLALWIYPDLPGDKRGDVSMGVEFSTQDGALDRESWYAWESYVGSVVSLVPERITPATIHDVLEVLWVAWDSGEMTFEK